MTHSARSISLIVLQEVKESCCWGAVAFNSEMKLLLFLLLAAIPDASSLSTESAFTGLVGGSVNVPCHYDVKYRDHVKYWCKGYQWTYCDILKQTDSTHHDSDKISISDDRTGGVFIVTMRRLDKEDTAWYWCAIKLGGTKEADQHFYLYLTVTEGIPSLSVTSNLITGSKGGSASVSCQYAQLYTEHVKYWCRGREWASCEILVRTDTPQTGGEKVSISDDKGKLPRFFTVTVRGLEKNDTGWYWCAIQKAAADERILLYLTVTDATTIKTTTHTTISMSTADESSTKQQRWSQNTTAIPPNNIPGNSTGSTTQRLEITTSTFSDSGSTQVAIMVAIGILVFFLVIAVICVIKYIQIKQGNVRKVSQQEDGDQRVDSPAPTGQPAGGEITYTAVSFKKKKQTTRKEKPSQIPGEATTYATLEFQKRDSPTGDMGTVCNAQPSDTASALYAAVVKRPNHP
ncbi:CMRF35-like molecule 8 [Acipenser oxyrinchus oxyrinchus]|uniref:CMRF35-like molecule 8 n=1 Tax=Acipenser oxyrinchus oxyrinchus TaxID=40147 RepID=A0AAD8GD45_ACIOX|nr:CMRF35-like molecule 8 [Acipenser oxyrinchus oxyrinchus]